MWRKLLVCLGIAAGVLMATTTARAENVLKFGTLAPQRSPWGQVLGVWQRAVKERTKGALEVRFYWNGTQGDELSMVDKIRAGQLHGAAITSLGLAKIYKPILVLQVPGLFNGWDQLDKARNTLRGEFEAAALAATGIRFAGFSDVGKARMFSRGFAVTGPSSLRGHKPFVGRENDITGAVYQAIGGITPARASIPEVLPGLTSATIDVVAAPSLACEQLQWSSRLDHMTGDSSTMVIGAMVLSDAAIKALPEDQQTALSETGAVAARALTRRIRSEDDAATGRLRAKMAVHTMTPAERAEWEQIFTQVRQQLVQRGMFSAALMTRVEKMK
jgi:TRAP-type C4-dicarboxylate transport system substrate-binding protein